MKDQSLLYVCVCVGGLGGGGRSGGRGWDKKKILQNVIC